MSTLHTMADDKLALAAAGCRRRIAQFPYDCRFARQMIAKIEAEQERRRSQQ